MTSELPLLQRKGSLQLPAVEIVKYGTSDYSPHKIFKEVRSWHKTNRRRELLGPKSTKNRHYTGGSLYLFLKNPNLRGHNMRPKCCWSYFVLYFSICDHTVQHKTMQCNTMRILWAELNSVFLSLIFPWQAKHFATSLLQFHKTLSDYCVITFKSSL